jgi:hypothetical protein
VERDELEVRVKDRTYQLINHTHDDLPELVFEATFDSENYGPGISYDDTAGGFSTYNCLLY